jgi:hypothetical protein
MRDALIGRLYKGVKMKTKFTNCVGAFYGKLKSQGLIHCKYNQGNLVITRKYPIIEIEEHHLKFGSVSQNLSRLFHSLSKEYIDDLKNYVVLLGRTTNLNEKLAATHYGVYVSMMWKLKKHYPEIDMLSLTREDILKNEYPIRTIVEAMENGFLMMIPEGRILDKKM